MVIALLAISMHPLSTIVLFATALTLQHQAIHGHRGISNLNYGDANGAETRGTMNRRAFTKQELQDILWEEDEDSEIIRNEITDRNRWSVIYDFIFKKDDKIWQTHYSRGATEQQDELPWQYDEDVECDEVEIFEKTVVDYRPVSNGESTTPPL